MMKFYIGLIKRSNRIMHFTSPVRPTKKSHWYFDKVIGPYKTETQVRRDMQKLVHGFGLKNNPVRKRRG